MLRRRLSVEVMLPACDGRFLLLLPVCERRREEFIRCCSAWRKMAAKQMAQTMPTAAGRSALRHHPGYRGHLRVPRLAQRGGAEAAAPAGVPVGRCYGARAVARQRAAAAGAPAAAAGGETTAPASNCGHVSLN